MTTRNFKFYYNTSDKSEKERKNLTNERDTTLEESRYILTIYKKSHKAYLQTRIKTISSNLNTESFFFYFLLFIFYNRALLHFTDSFANEKGFARFQFESLFRLRLMLLKTQSTFITQGIRRVNGK